MAAALARSTGAARRYSDRGSPWYWNLRLLSAEILTIQSNRKNAAEILNQPVPSLPGLDQAEVRRLIDLIDNGAPAAQILDLEAKARAAVKDADLAIRLDLQRSNILYGQRRTAEAVPFAETALDQAHRSGNRYRETLALSNLCLYSRTLQRYEESVAYGERALTAADAAGARRIGAVVHGNLGTTYAWLGDFDAAEKHQQEAVRIFQQIGARPNLMIALGELGVLYDREDNLPKAREYYERAFNLARELGNNGQAARLAWNSSLTAIKGKQWDDAETWNRRSEELLRAAGNDKPVPPIERNRARIAWGRGRGDEAATICRQILAANPNEPFIRWESYYLLGLIDSAAHRYPQANRDFQAALDTIGQVRSELLDSANRIMLLSRLMPFYQAYVDTLVNENDDPHALRVMESSRARVLSERLGRKLEPQQFPTLASFQKAAADAHASILYFWTAPARSFAWLITANGVQRFPLPGVDEIAGLVTKYRETVEHSLRDPIVQPGPGLWHAIGEKIAPAIPKDASLIVIPDGPLHRLNLETLIVPGPPAHYWIEDVRMAVAPSITLVAASRAEPAAVRAILAIGSPDYKGTGWEPLPQASAEIRTIEQHLAGWTQRTYEGPKASPAAYRESNPAQFSVIHFAAHAEANHERPLESAVILSRAGGQYKLFARDVADIPIQARLVTLSACRTAGARAYGGEGLLGFAWAFLNAGAHSVIAGLWDVSDSSTSRLMDRLYAGIAGGEEPAAALRDAKLSLLHGPAEFHKPFYWAPFQIYLGGR